jgi:spore coat protein CotF
MFDLLFKRLCFKNQHTTMTEMSDTDMLQHMVAKLNAELNKYHAAYPGLVKDGAVSDELNVDPALMAVLRQAFPILISYESRLVDLKSQADYYMVAFNISL